MKAQISKAVPLTINMPFVSVIVPVYNDPERLKICLQALEVQTYPQESYEVIVVDNGSDSSIEPLVAQYPHVRTIHELQPGSYAARNAGIALSQGEVLAFTDSDCIPDTDWMVQGVEKLFAEPERGIVGGEIELVCKNARHPTAVELFDTVVMGFDQQSNLQVNRFSVTANLFTRSEVIKRCGGFDPTLKSRGDVEWGRRVAAAGYGLHYAREVRVRHPARASFRELYQRMVRLTGGFEDVARKHAGMLRHHERQEYSLSLRPSFETVARIWSRKELSIIQKIMVILVGVAVKYIKLQERLRLRLWGQSRR